MYDAIANSAEIVAGVLGIAVTVVAIIVELAATRYNHRITELFIREPLNIIILGFFVATTLACVWLSAWGDSDAAAWWHVVTMAMITVSLLALLPYFAYVFAFISPINVIHRVSNAALRALEVSDRRRLLEAVDELQDVLRSAIDAGDRDIAMTAVDALADLLGRHDQDRRGFDTAWFEVDATLRADPDFVSLEQTAIERLNENQSWLEFKVFSQLHTAVDLCIPKLRDVANLISIRTRQLAVDAQPGSPMFDMATTSLHSYLRTCINARDPRTAYYILSQYRLVAEALIDRAEYQQIPQLTKRLQFYGQLGFQLDQPFILEVCAFDLVQILERLLSHPNKNNEAELIASLLDALLQLDRPLREELQESSLAGVRRAQIRAATVLLEADMQDAASQVVSDLRTERQLSIDQLIDELASETESQFWELTPRGINFAYLPTHLRPHLASVRQQLTGGAGP